ncbi:hypothetical protein ABOM_004835 [Aspergillus bombycis]|uniref:Putative zinc-finger domain-containing protein n=1 Tax=Aspergillus bombycis TaxID=109264 RepID=A0A1F8A3Z4_9EURO|nr:hypothetical protein ABOM_004835 [Aspergillus bombycis]OGM46441.1 hypothetical protein ABOM_004835 [Aspergillus bombycis]
MPVYQQSQDGTRYPLDYNDVNFAANSLPGLGASGPSGSLPPPPFPFMGNFAHSQFPPPPFPPMQMPPLRYPPMPVSTAPINTPPGRPLTSDFQPNSGSVTNNHPQVMTSSAPKEDLEREEGELTDREGDCSQQGIESRHSTSPPSSKPGPRQSTTLQMVNGKGDWANKTNCNGHVPKGSRCVSSEVEEGEASSTSSNSFSRDSGSPYNPPMSVNVEPFVPAGRIADEATPKPIDQDLSAKSVFSPPTTDPQVISNCGKSPAQLRVQAQGALLSLAPHNIRYGELVGEGINPMVLRQLYEEVGIKVPTPQPDTISTQESSLASTPRDHSFRDLAASIETAGPGEKPAAEAVRVDNVTHSTGLVENAPTSTPPSQPCAAKPMERKEVIARMLAAKAAKSTGAPTSPSGDVTKEAQTSDSSTTDAVKVGDTSVATEVPVQEKEVRVREKNKAQTELARQRIEQLKKQGLMRLQQKSTSGDVSPSNDQPNMKSTRDLTPTLNSSSIQHPLPERPPDPETGAFARIPGLFMTEVAQASHDDPSTTPTQGLLVDSTPQPRFNQRKRPRASDFDEPVPLPRNTSNNGVNNSVSGDRLVIDISDDDLYGDDEDDAMDIETFQENDVHSVPEGQARTYLLAESLPPRPVTSSSQGLSLSATPQFPRNNDQEDLRRKDLEIQAMHRRIAELENRKRAKLAASRTQSPRAADSESSPPETSVPTDTEARETPTRAAPVPAGYNSSQVETMDALPESTSSTPSHHPTSNGLSCRLGSMDAEQLNDMKLKVLRKKEIESGVPALDAEIERSETRLARFNLEQEKLLLDITRGREGRQQLLEELSNLNIELDGVSLEEVESALGRLTTMQEPANEAQDLQPNSPDDKDVGISSGSQVTTQLQEQKGSIEEPSVDASADTAKPSLPSDITAGQHDVSEASRESTPTSSSDSTGSSMDESSDEDSDDSDDVSDESTSAEQEESNAHSPVPDIPMSEVSDGVEQINQVEPSPLSEGHHDPLPGQPQATNATDQSDMFSRSSEQDIEMTEDQASDKSMVSEAYEPPEPEGNASPADSVYSPPLVQLLLALLSPPFLVPQCTNRRTLLVGLLDNARQPGVSDHMFSPYISPLKSFKAFRYHPKYTDEVTGGYRSLTYSHNIDPMVYICPFEGAGGVCNDRSCEFQHFRDMTLSDDKILVQMGSLREGKTPEEKDNYIAGLKNIINDMRRDKVKDFNTVATEIAAYRRRFLQDPSRVLPL